MMRWKKSPGHATVHSPKAQHGQNKIRGGLETGDKITALLTMSASYNISEHWLMRASWDRVLTGYDKDSDIFLAGAGYRF